MASLSVEEENYVRMSLVLTGISSRAVRTKFDNEFAPACLGASLKKEYNKLFDLKKKHRINQSEWNLLFPRFPDVPNSKDFDVTLMIFILRNLTPLIPPHCGFDCLPADNDISPAADLARIKYYRNYLAHLEDGKIEITAFITAWNNITNAIARLGGQLMKQECDHMKTKSLDQTNQDIMMDIKHSQNEIWELKESLESIKLSHELLRENHALVTKEMKEIKITQQDTVPWNIRAQHRLEIREWEQDQNTFVETRATRHILESLSTDNCIVVTGSFGCGKSSTIHYVALQLRTHLGYDIIPVLAGPKDIINYYDENKNQVFVVDDVCGKETINKQTLQLWIDKSEKIEKIFKIAERSDEKRTDGNALNISGPKLMMTCRLHIFKEAQFKLCKLLIRKEHNLLSAELCLLQEEKKRVSQMYLQDNISEKINATKVILDVDFFPLLCNLSKEKSLEEVINLLTSPVDSITKNIIHIVLQKKEQFYGLVLCILFHDGFNTDWLKLKSAPDEKKDKLDGIVKEFDIDLNEELSRNALMEALETLDGTYLNRRGTEYRMIHDKIYEMAAVICGKHLTGCFIKYAPAVFIRDHFIFESTTKVHENDGLIVLSEDKEEEYFLRLLCDLKEFVITSTFRNKQLLNQSFMDKLISFFKRSGDAKTLLKTLNTKGCTIENDAYGMSQPSKLKTTPLIESAFSGYFALVYFLVCNIDCNVNDTDGDGRSPLYKASERGHSEVVKLLLEMEANDSKCSIRGQSALYMACKGGYTDIVNKLLQNNSDVCQRNIDGKSLLYVACKGGHTDIVKLLLCNGADVSHCNNNSQSPFHVACKGGHTDIVQLLLKTNANIFKCNDDGESPFHVACEGGHTNTVSLLLNTNADVSQCNTNGESPLYMACKGGHKDTVKLLLQNNSDISKCNDDGDSPFHVACKGGHSDTVGLLLQKSADVSQCNRNGQSPLFMACLEGHSDTVDLLLKNSACIYKSDSNGMSPLFVACKGGYTDTVELLLQKNADVSQCNGNDESPLFMACKEGRTNIVKMLMQKNADVSQCNRNEESPLYMACKGGHTDIVKLLLQNNADVSQCNKDGQSPFYTACGEGHIDVVKVLLPKTTDIAHCDNVGGYPLLVACSSGNMNIVKLLLQTSANVSKCNEDGVSPLFVACEKGHTSIVKLLLEKNADVSKCNIYGVSPLLVACEEGHRNTISMLLQNNADVYQYNEEGICPLHEVCYRGYKNLAELLLLYKADVSQCDRKKVSSLYLACERGHKDVVNLLLQNDANVSQCNFENKSPLYVACKGGYTDIVELLLQNNADVSKCDNEGKSPLWLTCKEGLIHIVGLLLQKNADISQCNNEGKSPLWIACSGGFIDTVELLLKNNADVSQCDYKGKSPLWVACKEGYTDIVDMLLQNNAGVSQCEQNEGQSPLHVACNIDCVYEERNVPNVLTGSLKEVEMHTSQIEIVKLLIARNADVNMFNKNGKTPLDIARESSCVEIVNLLEENLQVQATLIK